MPLLLQMPIVDILCILQSLTKHFSRSRIVCFSLNQTSLIITLNPVKSLYIAISLYFTNSLDLILKATQIADRIKTTKYPLLFQELFTYKVISYIYDLCPMAWDLKKNKQSQRSSDKVLGCVIFFGNFFQGV